MELSLKEMSPEKIKAIIQQALKEEVKVTVTTKASKELKDVVNKLNELVKNLKDISGKGSSSAGSSITNINEIIALINALKAAWVSAAKGTSNRKKQAEALEGLVQNLNIKIGNIKNKGTEVRTEIDKLRVESEKAVKEWGKFADQIRDSVKEMYKEDEWIMLEYKLGEDIIKIIKDGKQKKSRRIERVIQKIKNAQRREKRRAGAQKVSDDIVKISIEAARAGAKFDDTHIKSLLQKLKVFESETLVDVADKLEAMIKGKEDPQVDWAKALSIAEDLEKVLRGWDAAIKELEEIIKRL
jgi:chromosome segregation ATPase